MPTQNSSKKYIIGNWKTAPATPDEAVSLFSEITASLQAKTPKGTDIVICPPTVYLSYFASQSGRKSKIRLGVQNIYAGEKASCTGEINAAMAKNTGAHYAIVGHSERREWETDEMVARKVAAALAEKIIPVVCIGEEKRDEDGSYLQVIADQLAKRLAGISRKDIESVIIAYEPVWAIGAAAAMSAEEVHQMTIFIKKTLMNIYKVKSPLAVPVLYGGSVDPVNAHGIINQGNTNGLLIGRQSLAADSFINIIRSI